MAKMKVSGVLEKRCKGCGICVEFCPKKVFVLNNLGKAVAESADQCTGCRICEYRCPDFAIQFQEA